MMPRSHRVAKLAFDRVSAHRNADFKKKYAALAHKLPSMILQNGMAQATGFLLAKGAPEHTALLDDFAAVLKGSGGTDPVGGRALHEQIIAAPLRATMSLTRQGLDASTWIKRYVQGVLKLGATGEAADEEAS